MRFVTGLSAFPAWRGTISDRLEPAISCRSAAAVLYLSLIALFVAWPSALFSGQTLEGRFLVASPTMSDPYFAETVIYMIQHDANGAMGLVVNRPVGAVPYADMLDNLGIEAGEESGQFQIYGGGPVERGSLFILHTADVVTKASQALKSALMLSSDPGILRRIAMGEGPRSYLVVLGYAGWGPGQLETELDRGGWESVEFDEKILFDMADEIKWERALQQQEIAL